MKDDFDKANLNCEFEDIIVCERSVNFDFIDQVANIPVNEKKRGRQGTVLTSLGI